MMRVRDTLFLVGVALAVSCSQGVSSDGSDGDGAMESGATATKGGVDSDAATADGSASGDTSGSASGDTTGSTPCVDGQVFCGDECVDRDSDPQHCGSCDAPCPQNSSCADGVCGPVQCGPGETWCEDSESCEDLTVGPDNCGACGNTCGTGEACIGAACINCDGGACDDACADLGLAYCGGAFGCKDIMNEAAHCGACGRDCYDDFSQVACGYGDVNVEFSCEAGYCVWEETGVPCEPTPGYGVCPAITMGDTGPDFYCCTELFCEGKCAACPNHHTCINDVCVFQDPCGTEQTPCCAGLKYPWPGDTPFYCTCCDADTEQCEVQQPSFGVQVATCVPK